MPQTEVQLARRANTPSRKTTAFPFRLEALTCTGSGARATGSSPGPPVSSGPYQAISTGYGGTTPALILHRPAWYIFRSIGDRSELFLVIPLSGSRSFAALATCAASAVLVRAAAVRHRQPT